MPTLSYDDYCLPDAVGRDRAQTPPNTERPIMEPLLASSTPGERYLIWAFQRDVEALVALGFVRTAIGDAYDAT